MCRKLAVAIPRNKIPIDDCFLFFSFFSLRHVLILYYLCQVGNDFFIVKLGTFVLFFFKMQNIHQPLTLPQALWQVETNTK